jgi:hypothetical protein
VVRPEWSPTTADVAAYVPTRTLDDYPNPDAATQPELGVPSPDFTEATTPTKFQVESFIDAAVAVVRSKFPLSNEFQTAIATQAAAVRAAAMVELSSPRTDSDVNVYQELMALYQGLVVDGVAASGAGAEGSVSGNLVPQWSFPVPVPWGDDFI